MNHLKYFIGSTQSPATTSALAPSGSTQTNASSSQFDSHALYDSDSGLQIPPEYVRYLFLLIYY